MVHAVLVPAAIARGRAADIDDGAARSAPAC